MSFNHNIAFSSEKVFSPKSEEKSDQSRSQIKHCLQAVYGFMDYELEFWLEATVLI